MIPEGLNSFRNIICMKKIKVFAGLGIIQPHL
jgi:hypothetical protein